MGVLLSGKARGGAHFELQHLDEHFVAPEKRRSGGVVIHRHLEAAGVQHAILHQIRSQRIRHLSCGLLRGDLQTVGERLKRSYPVGTVLLCRRRTSLRLLRPVICTQRMGAHGSRQKREQGRTPLNLRTAYSATSSSFRLTAVARGTGSAPRCISPPLHAPSSVPRSGVSEHPNKPEPTP